MMFFIGKVINTYCDQSILSNGVVDFEKVQPILFVMNDRSYYTLSKKLAKAWDVGKEFEA
jgi:flavin reductase (DIM6/NTAB) family NADH-FMN oxidoreductase RutF